jgi:hypothetical protein
MTLSMVTPFFVMAFSLRSYSSCYADEYMTLFTMHCGRDQ